MSKFPDVSEILRGERLKREEAVWLDQRRHVGYADEVRRTCAKFDTRCVVEVGCGTGLLPEQFADMEKIVYIGIDSNPEAISIARAHNPSVTGRARQFIEQDIRVVRIGDGFTDGVVCCFATLKHFYIDEWADILCKVLALGRVGLFSIQTAAEHADNGSITEGHNTWVTDQELANAIASSGHREVHRKCVWVGAWQGVDGKEWIITTERESQ